MSTEATQWAIEIAQVPKHLFAVLVCLAWKADDHGRGAFPSEPTIAKWIGKSDRQVRTDLRELEAKGLILRGDQSLAAHIRADRRPTVWDLAMTNVPVEATPGSPRPEADFRPEVHDRPSASGRKSTTGSPVRHDRKPASANMSLIQRRDDLSPSLADTVRAADASATEDEIDEFAKEVIDKHAPDDLDRYVAAWSAEQITAKLAAIRRRRRSAATGTPARSAWCGQCDQRTRMLLDEYGRPGDQPCPRCRASASDRCRSAPAAATGPPTAEFSATLADLKARAGRRAS